MGSLACLGASHARARFVALAGLMVISVSGCSTRDDIGDPVYIDPTIDGGDDGLRLDARVDATRDAAMDADAADTEVTRPDAMDVDDAGKDATPEQDATPPDAPVDTDAGTSDTGTIDTGTTTSTCAGGDLGMATGASVRSGSTTTGAAALTPSTCSFGGTAPELTFSWTAPETGTFAMTTAGSSFDTVLYIREYDVATCAVGAEIACNDDSIGVQSSVRITATMGTTYFVVVDGYSTSSGDFVLNIASAAASETSCEDGLDEDADGYVDCRDSDCASLARCVEDCHDDIDNDGDGSTDCYDYDCDSDPGCVEVCDDGIDNDDDFTVDCADYDCTYAFPGCIEDQCDDGDDNDGDGQTDCRDYDCAYEDVCRETNCDDGIDNEGDGLIDCDDYSDCPSWGTGSVCGEYYCTDGRDDEGDGNADCSDRECACDLACAVDTCPNDDLGSVLGAHVADGMLVSDDCSLRYSGCGGSAAERTFTWLAPSAGTYSFTTEGSQFETVIYLLDGSCTDAELACDAAWDATDRRASTVTTDLAEGQAITIVVDGYDQSDVGRYVLGISRR